MAKQKIVVKVIMEDAKRRSKALKVVVGMTGVVSVQIEGDKIVVIGDDLDSIKLITMLRKKMGFVELVSVGAVEEKKDAKKEEMKEKKDAKKKEMKEKKEEADKSVQPLLYQVQMAAQPYFYEKLTEQKWFESTIIEKVIDMGKTRFGNNWELLPDGENMLRRLEDACPQMQLLIDVAEMRIIMTDDSLQVWLQQLKDVAYEADDVIDDLESKHKESKEKVIAPPPHSELENFKSILKKLDVIAANVSNFIEVLDLPKIKEAMQKTEETRETSSLLLHNRFFGRDHEIDAIVGLLLPSSGYKPVERGASSSSGSSLKVIPILGVGGVGKTALAQQIYNHEKIAREFEVMLWVSLPDNRSVKDIAKQMVQNLQVQMLNTTTSVEWEAMFCYSDCQTDNLEDILKALGKFLANKRFFIVLDNLWDDTGAIWVQLCPPLTKETKGSTVLVTTQSRITAERINTAGFGPVVLDFLEEKDFQELFEYYAFGDKKNFIKTEKLEELQSIGRQIARKLHGLPLAGKIVGSLLQSNFDAVHWNRVRESEWWELDFCLKGILPSLGQSFRHLSSNLKQCFAYCSIFPKGFIFEKDMLVHMWMAQGYIQPDKRGMRRMEDIGIEWFDELTYRSFFQLNTMTNQFVVDDFMLELPIKKRKFVINDLMQELAICVSLKECFVLDNDSIGIPRGVRHLSLRTNRSDLLSAETGKLKGLRTTTLSFDSEEFSELLMCFCEQLRGLRMLDLSGRMIGMRSLPNVFRGLSHLRYLDLSYTGLEHLPETICGLFLLQVLNLKGCPLRSIPKGICNLVRLQHLYADSETLALVSNIGKLSNLQELTGFYPQTKTGHRIGELEHMRELRELDIIIREDLVTKEEALKAMLHSKEHLQSLKLRWEGGSKLSRGHEHEMFVVACLRPHCNLKELVISGFQSFTSSWMTQVDCFPCLQAVYLSSCDTWSWLPFLGSLQFLKILYLERMSSITHVGGQFYGNKKVAFPSLEELVICEMRSLEEWSEVEQGRRLFPRLRKIHLIYCLKLRTFPLLSFDSSSVEELVIRDCNILETALLQRLQNLKSPTLNLKSLTMLECSWVMVFYLGLHSLTALRHLRLHGNEMLPLNLMALEGYRQKKLADIASLTHLRIDVVSWLTGRWLDVLGELPALEVLCVANYPYGEFKYEEKEWFGRLVSLQELTIQNCTNLIRLPPFSNSLKKLSIKNCPSLLLVDPLPTSLKELHVIGCRKLKEQCQKKAGPDWIKISHIPCIRIDGETIQMLGKTSFSFSSHRQGGSKSRSLLGHNNVAATVPVWAQIIKLFEEKIFLSPAERRNIPIYLLILCFSNSCFTFYLMGCLRGWWSYFGHK